MNALPQLRTVRSASPPVTPAAAARSVHPLLAPARIPAALRELLQELLDLRLVPDDAVGPFLAAAGVADLTTRDRAAAALGRAGLLTPYQLTRVLGGTAYGLVLGPYRVLDRTGGGSVGVVFTAEHVTLGRRVAVKAVPADLDADPGILDRFRTEGRRLAAIDHPNVVAVIDAGEVPSPGPGKPGLLYLAMELVDGGDVEQAVCAGGAQPVERVCDWGRQAAAGLAAVHTAGLVHRDIKPPNLLLTSDGRVKLADFGLVRDHASTTTPRGSLVGSVEFMPPEQAADATAVGPPADVYGLAASLFWALTGELPVKAFRTPAETIRTLLSTPPRSVTEFRPDVPPALDRLLQRMLDRDPAVRPTAAAVAVELATLAGGDDPARLKDSVRVLERALRAREADARAAGAMVLDTLAGVTATHDGGSPAHGRRLREYLRLLVARLAGHRDWAVLADNRFVGDLLACAPLHDLGMLGVPDQIPLTDGLLNGTERAAVEAHVRIGCDILHGLGQAHGPRLPWLSTARAIVRSHHERWDGAGYPDGLSAAAIPPAARLVAVADAYDSLRRPRPDRPGHDHTRAVGVMLADDGWFDPAVREAFRACADGFRDIYDAPAVG
jgi:hypothetical protein